MALVVAAGVLVVAPVAFAATIEVRPGPNAIHKALRSAHSGDTLRIHDGTYRESVAINKRVTLRGVGGRPTSTRGATAAPRSWSIEADSRLTI